MNDPRRTEIPWWKSLRTWVIGAVTTVILGVVTNFITPCFQEGCNFGNENKACQELSESIKDVKRNGLRKPPGFTIQYSKSKDFKVAQHVSQRLTTCGMVENKPIHFVGNAAPKQPDIRFYNNDARERKMANAMAVLLRKNVGFIVKVSNYVPAIMSQQIPLKANLFQYDVYFGRE